MAEAAVEDRPPQRFYCHMCHVQFQHASADFTCPHCSDGFIEELLETPENSEEMADVDDWEEDDWVSANGHSHFKMLAKLRWKLIVLFPFLSMLSLVRSTVSPAKIKFITLPILVVKLKSVDTYLYCLQIEFLIQFFDWNWYIYIYYSLSSV
nr:unnamed protein product [Callosobruchus analis]